MSKPNYLPNLDALRAISVLIVMIGHATSLQAEFGKFIYSDWLWIPGKFGVIIFFCISGLLITYLLDAEKERDGSINIRRFMFRRALRILPLYFAVTIPAILLNEALVGTHIHYDMAPVDYVLVLLGLPGYGDRPMFVGQTWSIGIEETFYLVFPLMIAFLSRRALIVALIIIVFSPDWMPEMSRRVSWAPQYYACLAIGCLSYLAYSANGGFLQRWLFHRVTQWIGLASVLAITFLSIRYGETVFDFRVYAAIFAVVIVNLAFNPQSVLWLEWRPLNYLGRISYGMYMYHVYCICAVLLVCRMFTDAETFPLQNWIVDGGTIALTVLISKLSYDWFENPIRRLARREPASVPA